MNKSTPAIANQLAAVCRNVCQTTFNRLSVMPLFNPDSLKVVAHALGK
jgi:hypothetical protein